MNRTKFLLSVLLVSCALCSNAQRTPIGIRLGGGMDILWGNSIVRQFSRPLPTGLVGLFVDVPLADNWSNSVELNYAQRGTQIRIQLPGDDTKTIYQFNYLSMPITLKHYFNPGKNKTRLYIGGGGYMSILQGARYRLWQNDVQIEDKRVDDEFTLEAYGTLLSIGAERAIGSALVGSFEVRNSIGLNNISDIPLIDGSLRTYSTKFVLGLRLN